MPGNEYVILDEAHTAQISSMLITSASNAEAIHSAGSWHGIALDALVLSGNS